MIWKKLACLSFTVGLLMVATATAAQPTSSRESALVPVSHLVTVELPYAWEGTENITTEAFEAGGQWEVVLGAWCHIGVSFVNAEVYNHEGEPVGRVRVIGEGVRTQVFDTEPGIYYISVTSPDMDVYTWELMVRPVEGVVAPAAPEQVGQVQGGEGAVGGELSSPLSGVVEIAMSQDGSGAFFDPLGVWVEPGTTIRFVLAEGVHDSQAYHPANAAAVQLLRIPEGAEPWNSGLLGGLLNPTGVFEVTLTVEGVYDYFCMPHHALGMVGRIVVGDPNASPARPVDEIPYESARLALPSVEEILESVVVHWRAP